MASKALRALGLRPRSEQMKRKVRWWKPTDGFAAAYVSTALRLYMCGPRLRGRCRAVPTVFVFLWSRPARLVPVGRKGELRCHVYWSLRGDGGQVTTESGWQRIFRNAVLYFEEDTSTLEASVSEDHEHIYKQMEANKMKPAQITVNLREFKGQRFLDVTGYQPASPGAAASK